MKEFIDLCYPDLFPYQRKFLENLQSYKRMPSLSEIMIKQRQHSKRIMARIELEWNLLNNKDVLDFCDGLHYHFEKNDLGELELLIDEYSQPTGRHVSFIVDDVGDGNIPPEVFNTVIKVKKKKTRDLLLEALEVIKEIT